jgi:hypothetical protein
MNHLSNTGSVGKITRRIGDKVLDILQTDLTETNYGHRILDQIFREGKFAPKKSKHSKKHKKAH